MERFVDRRAAGKLLANELSIYANRDDVIVLALPRGGVPVAFEIAKKLSVPLDVFIVRKLGVPGQEELAIGAIATGGVTVFNHDVLQSIFVSKQAIQTVIDAEQQELARREKKYRGNRSPLHVKDKTILLVDDGIATGATMRAAIKALAQQQPAAIIVAVPVAALSTYEEMKTIVDRVVCPITPDIFYAVGNWYESFPQTTDEEVSELLNELRNKK